MRRAGVEFCVKLSRDTGVNPTDAYCEALLETIFVGESGEPDVGLQSDPGLFYASLGFAVANQTLRLDHADYQKVAWLCYREAAVVHEHPGSMNRVAWCYYRVEGVRPDSAQAAFWFQKAADLGDLASRAALGAFLLRGDSRAGVAKDAARGFELLRKAVEQGFSPALFQVASCYLRGEGVEEDAAHGVALSLQVTTQEDAVKTAMAQSQLVARYVTGNGVEADTTQAAMWCQRAADGGDEDAIEMLPMIRTCTFCGTTRARQHCERCRKVRYCNAACQAAHWHRETDPHKGHCQRAAASH